MVVADYFKTVERLLSNSKLIVDKTVDFKEFSSDEGMARGRLLFLGGYVLTFMEYIQTGKERLKYRFNLTDGKGNMIFRYDNAAHHKEDYTYPHHKHVSTGVKPSKEIGLAEVLSEIESMILAKFES
ncbi:MAG: DUF6516 family protein [Candidatus Methanoperedens sp.]|nr:DUF6516 family protein [Candidatus Methanoperedens sp.]MCZ7395242.1 DUF6516 family protein [Candidatus Methanoperedens sp.]